MTTPLFSLVYPTRHRPEFIRQALRILKDQDHESFEVIVCDNAIDLNGSCELVCRESGLANLKYLRPPRPFGMVDNWNHALTATSGRYICYLTDKMFFLPGALSRIQAAVEAAREPEIVTWTSDAYNPESSDDYFGPGRYVTVAPATRETFRRFSPTRDLDRRGRATVARGEQSSADYCRGKLVFGAYGRPLIDRILDRFGALFHNISPDYTSMIMGASEAHDAIELGASCVVSVNTAISNGMLADTNDQAALAFLDSLAGGSRAAFRNMLVPGLYASQHNVVAHDFLLMQRTFGLSFEFDVTNWLVYCTEDIYRASRRWSSRQVEAQQKTILADFIRGLDRSVADAVADRLATRARPTKPPRSLRAWVGSKRPRRIAQQSPSIEQAIHTAAAARRRRFRAP